ncbi:MAG: diguanylate cyclase [Dehalococcoidia bacterium]|jgi:diguanylate cyclase (GGDEF)-like protein/PAS domain S-box-containing protein
MRDSLGHRSAVAAAVEKARAESLRSTTLITAAVFAEDATPFVDSWRQANAERDAQLSQARAGLTVLGDTDALAALDTYMEQTGQTAGQVEAILGFAATADVSTRIDLGRQQFLPLWDETQAQLAKLDELVNGQETALTAERSAADSSAQVTLALMLALSAFAFLGGAATLSGLFMSVVRPLAALRTSARAVAAGDLETRARVAGPEEIASLARDFNEMVAQRGRTEEALRSQSQELGNRAKELNCLYGISNLVQRPDISLEEILQGTVDLIPPAWRYPEITCARIALGGRQYLTESFRETVWRQTGDIIVNGERTGVVEVCYLEERPESDEGPFLTEERSLLNAIAERLGRVSERRQAEEALRESEEKYRRIFDSIQDMYFRTDARGIIMEVSPSVERWGYSREKLIGTQVMDLYDSPEQRSALLKKLAEEGGEISDYEIRLKVADGRAHADSVSCHVLRGPDGTFVGTEGIVRDIAERKRAEEALREIEDALHEQARRDPLTGVLNHGAILDDMRSLISTGEHATPWAAAMIDVDRLKVTNDTYGHQVGDAVLVAVAAALSRDDALVGRYGGDEFVAILPSADRNAAERYREDATDALAHATITDPQTGASVRAEASIGLAIYPEDGGTLADLIKVSDDAMYALKRQRPVRRPSPRKHAPDRKAA